MSREYRHSKVVELVMYIANKPTKMSTYSELYEVFVERKKWPKSTLDVYLSRLASRHILRRSWLKVGGNKRIRVYSLNPEYFKQG
jgi:predicted transcriptional regulator